VSDVAFQVAAVVVCLVGSAFFSGAETALTALDRTRTRRLIDRGERFAGALELWLKRPAELLTTLLIFNNVVNVTASALATDIAQSLLGDSDLPGPLNPMAVAVGAMTLLLLTFGEITPKTIARHHADTFAPIAATLLQPLFVLTRPFNAAFVAMSTAISRADGHEGKPFVSEEDLGYLFELGSEEGSIPGDQAEILESVLELDNKTARDVMVPAEEVVAVPLSMRFDELLPFVVESGHSRIPVYIGSLDQVVGMIYTKDLLAVIARKGDPRRFHIRDIMRRVEFTTAAQPIDALLRRMKDKRVHLTVVRDAQRVLGVVALEDIIETLIGEVFDEYDDEEAAEYLAAQAEQQREHDENGEDDDDDVQNGTAIRPGQLPPDEVLPLARSSAE